MLMFVAHAILVCIVISVIWVIARVVSVELSELEEALDIRRDAKMRAASSPVMEEFLRRQNQETRNFEVVEEIRRDFG